MGKKTKIIILLMFIAIIIIAALFLSGAFTKKDNNNHNNNGNNDIVENKNENYSAMVDISVVNAGEKKDYNINFEKGINMQRIEADYVSNIVFYQDNNLIYRSDDDNQIYNYEIEYNYDRVAPLLNSLTFEKPIREGDGKKTYEVSLTKEFVQEIYKNLYIEAPVNYESNAEITMDDEKILDAGISSVDENGNEIVIIIDYDYLDNDFKVNDNEISNHSNYEDHNTKGSGVIGPPDEDYHKNNNATADNNILKIVI